MGGASDAFYLIPNGAVILVQKTQAQVRRLPAPHRLPSDLMTALGAVTGDPELGGVDELLQKLEQGWKPVAQSPELQEVIDRLYQTSDQYPGGTAGAVRHEIKTGQLLSPSGHTPKALERAAQIAKMLARGSLPAADTMLAKAMVQDLRNAVAGH